MMAISKDELVEMVKKLPQSADESAYDYLRYLTLSHARPNWDEIKDLEPDEIPLSEEEKRQLNETSEFVSWEEAMNELDLPIDTQS